MIPLLHKSIKKNLKFKSLGDLWVRERSFFLSFFLSLQCSVGQKKIQPISPKDFIKFFIIIIISWDAAAEDFSALDSS
jgi:hypothetical protein